MQASTARDRFASGAVIAATGLSLVSAALGVVMDPSPLRLLVAVGVVAFLSVPLVGAAAVRAGAGGAVGWLMIAAGLALPVAAGGYLYSGPAYERGLPGATLAAWLDGWLWVPALVLVPTVGLLLLPDGSSPSKRGRPLLVGALLVAGAIALSLLFGTELLDYPDKPNPTALPGVAGEVANGLGIAIAVMGPLTTAIAISLGRRRREAGDTPRGRALGLVVPASWTVAASWWACLVIAAAFDGDPVYALPAEMVGLVAVAATAWVGIRRYGLLDVRPVLSRTLVYGLLSGLVVVVYLLVAAAVGAIADPASSSLAVVVAFVVALPLHQRLQRWVNRQVYGYRDDPRGALDQLGQRLADAADGDSVLATTAVTTRQSLRLRAVVIELDGRRSAIAGPEPAASAISLPLVFAGEEIGRMVVDPGPERLLQPGETSLLGQIAAQVSAAAHAVRLTHDLVRSRERIITATEEERRRLRRDLHDGLGPALAGVVLGLHRARNAVSSAPAAAEEQISALTGQVQDAVAEVRRLVYGLRPPALDELGLLGAIEEQATLLGIDAHPVGPSDLALPAAVEVAAYRIAVEAMTNTARHASARRCEVEIGWEGHPPGRLLRIEVNDDGRGRPDSFRAGVGITSMRERAAELGGSCEMGPRAGGGTRVLALIPLPSGAGHELEDAHPEERAPTSMDLDSVAPSPSVSA